MGDGTEPGFKLPIRVSVAAILLMLAASVLLWLLTPADLRLPVHWGIDGQPDRYGSKWEAGLVIPGVAAVLLLLFSMAPRLEPRRQHLQQSAKAFRAIWMGTIGFLAVIHLAVVASGLGAHLNFLALTSGLIGLLFVVMGNYLGKTRSTFFLGIRTPWTLSSERVWDRTHRLGGRLFMLAGVVTVALALLAPPSYAAGFMLAGGIGVALVSVVYSYLAWRQEGKPSGAGH